MTNGSSLLDAIKGYLTPDVMQRISSLSGETPVNAQRAMSSIVPTVLSGAAKLAESPGGDNQLIDLISNQTRDGNVLNDLAAKLGGGSATDNFIASGHDIVKGLFGNKMGSVIDMLGRSVGMKSSVVSSLLSVAAPIVMGVLGKEKNARGLGAAGLASLLAAQKSILSQFVPAGLGSLMGWSDNGHTEQRFTETPSYEAPRPVQETTTARRSDWWLLPALGLAALALLIYSFWPRGAVVPEQTAAEREIKPEASVAARSTPAVQDIAPTQRTEPPIVQESPALRRDSTATEDSQKTLGSARETERGTVEKSAPIRDSVTAGQRGGAAPDLRRVQLALKNQGQDPGPIDGVMGPRTREAVTQFQKANGLQPTGTLDETTMKRLVDIR